MTYQTNPFTNLPPLPDAPTHRAQRLARLNENKLTEQINFDDSPYMTPKAVRETYEGTQGFGQTHRLLTPVMQTLVSDARSEMMTELDNACFKDTELVRSGDARERRFDVAIIGSGPHGAAVAMTLREKYPNLRTVIIEGAAKLGGQWRNYGPKPCFLMNSRVRRANYNLAPIPRTPASINPMSRFATMELSDMVTGNYATNVEMGDVCAMNAYLAANATLVGSPVRNVEKTADGMRVLFGRVNLTVRYVVAAVGIRQQSALRNYSYSNPQFNTARLYQHFATDPNPLALFAGKKVAVVGAGDSALTCIEALLGCLPKETYGRYGVGRQAVQQILWIGAPGKTVKEIEPCLRARYKNGILQALPKTPTDKGATIRPILGRAVEATAKSVTVSASLDKDRFGRYFGPTSRKQCDVVIDCTSGATGNGFSPDRIFGSGADRIIKVGPGSEMPLREETKAIVDKLGVKANTVSLWATMPETDNLAMTVGQLASAAPLTVADLMQELR